MQSQHILITGASSGIGQATAKLLAEAGHRISLLARSESKLIALQESLGGKGFPAVADVRNAKDVARAVIEAEAHFGPIDVLINNAGVGRFNKLLDANLEEWHEMLDTNVKGVLNCIHAVLPGMKKAGKGHIINLGSVAAHQVFPNSGVYCATKHAVLAISESLRLELADLIKVTTLSPGAVNTAFIDQTTNKDLVEQMEAQFRNGLSAQHIAEQIKYVIEYDGKSVISEVIIRPNKAYRAD